MGQLPGGFQQPTECLARISGKIDFAEFVLTVGDCPLRNLAQQRGPRVEVAVEGDAPDAGLLGDLVQAKAVDVHRLSPIFERQLGIAADTPKGAMPRKGCASWLCPRGVSLVNACSDGGLHKQLVGQRRVSAQQRSGPVRFGAGIGGDSGLLQVKQPILTTRCWTCSSGLIEGRLPAASRPVKQRILASR